MPQQIPQVSQAQPNCVRQPLVRLKDSYTYSIEPTTTTQIFPSSPEIIELIEPIEINCFFGVIDEPSDPLSFSEANHHLGWKAAMKFE